MTSNDRSTPRATNSFDEMRFILAMIVVFGHATQLSSNAPLRPFDDVFDTHVAVSGFFAVSGYLVTKSYLSSAGLRDYFGKRLRRIYPAYLGVILFCLGIGALTTSLPLETFFTHPETLRYLAANLSLMNFLQPSLPGALQDNHLTALNGSLWTIKVEVMLYFTVPFLCLFYRSLGHAVTLALCLAGALVWYLYFTYYFGHPLGPTIGYQFPGQMGYFVMGSVLGFVTLSRVQLGLITVIFLLYYFAARPQMPAPWSGGFDMILIALFVIAIAASPILSIGIGRFGDVSYGIYLFHFPIIQAAEHFKLNESHPILTLIGTVALTLLMALLSWHVIEKRFLRRGSHYIRVAQG